MAHMQFLLDLLFPKKSLTGTEGGWITARERERMRLTPLLLSEAELRRQGIAYLDSVVAAGRYDSSPLLKKAILTFKYKRIPELAKDLSGWMLAAIPGLLILPTTENNFRTSALSTSDTSPAPILCPVPLHWSRRFWRGFNQAELLAKNISDAKQWPMQHLLKRVRATGHQAHRKREERLTALNDAFVFDERCDVPSTVILVDDLCTTGTTLRECAKALKKAGVKHVSALVVAYG